MNRYKRSHLAYILDRAVCRLKAFCIEEGVNSNLFSDYVSVPLAWADKSRTAAFPEHIISHYNYYVGLLDMARHYNSVELRNTNKPPYPRHIVDGVTSDYFKRLSKGGC